MNESRFTPAQITLMCDLMDDHDMTAHEVGKKFGLTKNAVIALRYRAGRSKQRGPEPKMAPFGQKPARPCLKCGSNAQRDTAYRICDNCKKSDVYSGFYGSYQ